MLSQFEVDTSVSVVVHSNVSAVVLLNRKITVTLLNPAKKKGMKAKTVKILKCGKSL